MYYNYLNWKDINIIIIKILYILEVSIKLWQVKFTNKNKSKVKTDK